MLKLAAFGILVLIGIGAYYLICFIVGKTVKAIKKSIRRKAENKKHGTPKADRAGGNKNG